MKLINLAFVVFLLIGCSPENDFITFSKSYDSTKSQKYSKLIKLFYEFWEAKAKGNINKMYEMEAPHFKYLHPFDKYYSYYGGEAKKYYFEVEDIKEFSKNESIIIFKLKLKEGETTRETFDKWLQVGTLYYHLTTDFIIFSE
jgi:hypothetical protein